MPIRHYKVLLEYDPQEKLWVTYVPAMDYLSTFGETRDRSPGQYSRSDARLS